MLKHHQIEDKVEKQKAEGRRVEEGREFWRSQFQLMAESRKERGDTFTFQVRGAKEHVSRLEKRRGMDRTF